MNQSGVPSILDFLLTEECYERIMLKGEVLNPVCLQLVASKLISIAIILSTALFAKLPQIAKIWSSSSVDGLSFMSFFLMVITSASTTAYCVVKDFPLSIWAENVILSLQNVVICLLILHYTGRSRALLSFFIAAYILSLFAITTSFVPMAFHTTMQMLTVPLTIYSKGIQCYVNFINSGTGQLSALSTVALCFRSFGRLFTHITEAWDVYRIAVFGSASLLNAVLMGQILYYWKTESSKVKSQ